MKKFLGFMVALAAVFGLSVTANAAGAVDTFSKVTSADQLKSDSKIIIVNESNKVALGTAGEKIRTEASYTTSESKILANENLQVITLETTGKLNSYNLSVGGNAYLTRDAEAPRDSLIAGNATAFDLAFDNGNVTLTTTIAEKEYSLEYNPFAYGFVTSGKSTGEKLQVYLMDEKAPIYNVVTFDANGEYFKPGFNNEVRWLEETTLTLNLPTAADLLLNSNIKLVAWTCGGNTYQPGQEVELTQSGLVFTAQYEYATSTIAEVLPEAHRYADSVTPLKYLVEGVVTDYLMGRDNSKDYYTITDGTGTMKVYGANITKGSNPIKVGSNVKVLGVAHEFNGTPEFLYPTMEALAFDSIVSAKASLALSYTVAENDEITIDKLSLRFGGILPRNCYNANAKYGVIIVDSKENYEMLSQLTPTILGRLIDNGYAREITPALLEDGNYQFAWKMTNMEGVYAKEFTAVIYRMTGNTIELSKPRTASVHSVCADYLEDSEILANPELVSVLNKIQEVK